MKPDDDRNVEVPDSLLLWAESRRRAERRRLALSRLGLAWHRRLSAVVAALLTSWQAIGDDAMLRTIIK